MPKSTSRHIQQTRDILAEMLQNLDWEVGTKIEIINGERVSGESIVLAKLFRDEYKCGKKKILRALKENDDEGEKFVEAMMSSEKVREALPTLCGKVQFGDKNEVCGTLVKTTEKEVPMKLHDGKRVIQ